MLHIYVESIVYVVGGKSNLASKVLSLHKTKNIKTVLHYILNKRIRLLSKEKH